MMRTFGHVTPAMRRAQEAHLRRSIVATALVGSLFMLAALIGVLIGH